MLRFRVSWFFFHAVNLVKFRRNLDKDRDHRLHRNPPVKPNDGAVSVRPFERSIVHIILELVLQFRPSDAWLGGG